MIVCRLQISKIIMGIREAGISQTTVSVEQGPSYCRHLVLKTLNNDVIKRR